MILYACRRLAAASFLVLMPMAALAAPLVPGSALPSLALENQHGLPMTVGADTRVVLFSAQKATSALVNEVLAADKTQRPPAVVHVADISGMPSVITRMFALPKLRELGFDVALAYKPEAAGGLPRRQDAVTVVHVRGGKVDRIAYVADAAALRAQLAARP
ncbi:hypothetical protein [Crenobacter caeni]|uniref:FAD/FMN-containing dehydrogenase n=1 Tax=Crenobacter caeni TaxID=2705474 RepID=A0A6B2KQU8_9NEIS|nr:hypothetical protein [Crenobacter caeni]NDV12528.1 hypothetical protein [Crenobacter caeni]